MLLKKASNYNFDDVTRKFNDKNVYKNFFLFIMGMTLSAISVSVFYKPYNIITTGSTGLAILISNYINIDLSLIILVISAVMFLIGLGVFGVEYSSKNILGTFLYPIFVRAASVINNFINFDGTSLFLIVLIGGVLSGIGYGLTKRSGYSTGGLSVLYDIVNEKLKISAGDASMAVNLIIILGSLIIYGISTAIYGFIGLYISSEIADRVMIGISKNKAFYIITKKPMEVKEYIINNLHHTVTIVNVKGGYTNTKKKMVMCVIPTIEYTRVKEVVKEIDKDVFFLITDCYFVSK